MKKAVFTLTIAAATLFANAQVSKGSWLIGASLGSLSFSSSNSATTYSNTPTEYKSDGKSFSLSINPTVAYFVTDNHAFGALLSFSKYNSTSNSSNTGSSTTSKNTSNNPSFYFGPYWRGYFGSNEKTKPFAQASFQFGFSGYTSKSTISTGASSETTSSPQSDWNSGAYVGMEHFLSKHLGLFVMVGGNYGKNTVKYFYRPSTGTGYDYTNSYTRFYTSLNVGFQVHL